MYKKIKVFMILIFVGIFITNNSVDVNTNFFRNNGLKNGRPYIEFNSNKVQAASVFYYWDKYTTVDGFIDNCPWTLHQQNVDIGFRGWSNAGRPIYYSLYTLYNYDQVNNIYSNQGVPQNVTYGPITTYYSAGGSYVTKYIVTKQYGVSDVYGNVYYICAGDIYQRIAENNSSGKVRGNLVQENIISTYDTFANDMMNPDGYWYVRKEIAGNSPELTVNIPKQQFTYSKEDIYIKPTITVKDIDNSSIACKYYIDGEAIPRETKIVNDTVTSQQVEFSPVSINTLREGEHSIKYVISDNLDEVNQTVAFRIDNTGPIIDNIVLSSTDKTISVESLESSDNSGINTNPYRFSLGSSISDWTSNSSYMFSRLVPNSMYSVKCESRDIAGNITTSEKSIYTKAQLPSSIVGTVTATTIDLNIISENPDETRYQLMCGFKYVDSNGILTDTPTWITIPHKTIKITGLSPNTSYNYKVKAKNMDGVETSFSDLKETKTYIYAPFNLATNPSSTSLVLSWTPVPGAFEYEVEADGIIKTVRTATFTHIDLIPNTQHSYRVRVKNTNGVCIWSPLITAITEFNVPENIQNNKSYITNTTASLVWDEAKDAEYYEIEFDGTIIGNIKKPFHTVVGLSPVTQYSYRVRAINSAGEGIWSNYETLNTYLLYIPSNINSIAGEKEVDLIWDVVNTASEYEIEINGQAPITISTNSYKHTGLTEETQYIYRIKAKNVKGESAWSNPITVTTIPIKPAIPNKFRAFTDENIVTLSWNSVDNAIGYDVELDGIEIDNGDSRTYIHEDLSPTTVHKYRVRAKTNAIEGDWTDYLVLKTMAGKPVVPKEIKVETTPTITTLSWKAEEEALGYDIEVDGEVVSNLTSTSYRHRRITPLTEHVYRIRTRNITGISPWSGYMINNSIKSIYKKGKDVDLGLTASDIVDFSKYTLTVTFNKDVLDVTDLCTFSPKVELTKGVIEGTGITITEFSSGKIVFVVDKSIPPGESWTGVINSIKFKAKVSGGTNITYTVFSKPEE